MMVAGRGCRKTQLWLERKNLWTSSEQKAAQHKFLTEMLWNLFIFLSFCSERRSLGRLNK